MAIGPRGPRGPETGSAGSLLHEALEILMQPHCLVLPLPKWNVPSQGQCEWKLTPGWNSHLVQTERRKRVQSRGKQAHIAVEITEKFNKGYCLPQCSKRMTFPLSFTVSILSEGIAKVDNSADGQWTMSWCQLRKKFPLQTAARIKLNASAGKSDK